MPKKFAVVRLEYLAFVACFKEIRSNLLLCREHRPEGKQALVSFSSFISRNTLLLTSENILFYIRSCMNQYCFGTMNDEIRKQFIERFNKTYKSFNGDTIDVWAFLDCVLDENFKELEVYSNAPDCTPDPRVISTIAKRSSQVEKLTISFSKIKTPINQESKEKLEPFTLGLGSLQNLTSLSLNDLYPSYRRSILKFLGKSCPLLSCLSLLGKHEDGIGKKDLLALVIGELVDHLLPVLEDDSNESAHKCERAEKKITWLKEEEFQCLIAPMECRVPLCSTLRHLEAGSSGLKQTSDAVIAFALRHFPLLERTDASVGMAIKILHDTREFKKTKPHLIFESSCREAVNRSGRELKLVLNPPVFSGFLPLTRIEISVLLPANVKLVGSVCPHLEEVRFYEKKTPFEKMHISPERLESALKNWPKLKNVVIKDNYMSSNLVTTILKVFGPNLLHLTLKCKLNLEDLVYCSRLESLRISRKEAERYSSEPSVDTGSTLDAKTFLPLLKTIESDVCLGAHQSRLFEEKCTLIRISLACCHIGTEASTRKDWMEVPKMWALLEVLKVEQCTGLTLTMLADQIIPRMSKLKELAVPAMIRYEESNRQLSMDILDKFSSRLAPTHVRFEDVFRQGHRDRNQECPCLRNYKVKTHVRTAGDKYYYEAYEKCADYSNHDCGPDYDSVDFYDPCDDYESDDE